jgi:hypothetical protein
MRTIGTGLLGTGVLVALAAAGTRLGQTLAAILVLVGGALVAASWLVRPPRPETDIAASPSSRAEDAIAPRD